MGKFWNGIGGYTKGILATVGAVITALTPIYGHDKWFTAVTAGLTAIVVVLAPNKQ